MIAVIFAARLPSTDHDGWAFTASAVAIAATVGSIFIDLYPNVMVSSTNAAYNLTVSQLRLGAYALSVMTIVDRDLLPGRADLPGLVLPRLPRRASRVRSRHRKQIPREPPRPRLRRSPRPVADAWLTLIAS